MGSGMAFGKVLKNFVAQLLVQNIWNFSSEQRPGMMLVLSMRSKRGEVVTPPRLTFNTNPYLASFITGILVREMRRSKIEDVSSLLETSLAAQGDDLYWRILRPLTLLAGVLLALLGQPVFGVLVFLVGFNLIAQGERLSGYVRGLRKGKAGVSAMIASIRRKKKILLPVAGVLTGVLCGAMTLNLGIAGFFIQGTEWFVFIPMFALAFLFALLRLSPLLNLVVNLIVLVIIGVMF